MNTIIVFAVVLAVANAGLIASPLLGHGLGLGLGLGHGAVGVVGPRLTVASGPVVAAGGILGHPALVRTAIIAPAGSGLEGQYIHDNLEKLYDDGQDRGDLVISSHLIH